MLIFIYLKVNMYFNCDKIIKIINQIIICVIQTITVTIGYKLIVL